jgi:catechol 2,3-dioxygenase-like lactoylglutathione lyase family enzyme
MTHAFAGLPVANYAAAYDWYVRLLGRPADMFPHASEAVWQLSASCSIYVVLDADRAGCGLITLALDDLAAHERHLSEVGLVFDEQVDGAAPRRLVVKDVDGNTLKFFQDPAQPGM